ncbi:MAG: AtpZ/AtpI family protein [Desulfomonilia bacterium]|nr:AtpZ/AtpI family protein [Desulfomonilia bacterium]
MPYTSPLHKEKLPRALANRLIRISSYSLVLVVTTYLGLYLGITIDAATGMAPNFTLLCLIAGIALGFRGFIQELMRERKA